ncbi:NAD dependent protein deacylase sirtuin5 mitochondrial [Echinococcus multilocularis]|uniref:NAD dependent protein deacylase sirtuin5 mitochondrial n=1 Tax=Echinococcus multilocularis TaxID=6211 RepID=A0A0S4MMM1_ECHMU|nr:NAD dependent protein deacylase sirtuin5 mitochondrial [Echinococcus multilocularis]
MLLKAPDVSANSGAIAVKDLPHYGECGGFLRLHVVWFNEHLPDNLRGGTSCSGCSRRLSGSRHQFGCLPRRGTAYLDRYSWYSCGRGQCGAHADHFQRCVSDQ